MSLQTRLASLITAIGADVKSLSLTKANVAYGGAEKQGTPNLTSGVLTLDVSTGSVFVASVNQNITSWVWSNVPVSSVCTVTVCLLMGSTLRTITTTLGGTDHWLTPQPTHVINKYTVYTFMTVDGGTNWLVAAAVEQ